MNDLLNIFVSGEPKPQPRTRACVRGKHAGTYDPGTAAGNGSLESPLKRSAKAAWFDDAQVTDLHVTKRYADLLGAQGAFVRIREAE